MDDERIAILDEAEVDARQLARDLARWERESAAHREAGVVCGCQGCILAATICPGHPAHPDVLLADIAAKRALIQGGEGAGGQAPRDSTWGVSGHG